jgi:transcriptional regulator with XRE-family HTH domain
MSNIIPIIQHNEENMGRIPNVKEGLPTAALNALSILGENIRTARKRRGWTLEAMSSSMFVSRKTLASLEDGDPSVGLAVLAAALHSFNMAKDLSMIADPNRDQVGMFNERQNLPKRVRQQKTKKENLEF